MNLPPFIFTFLFLVDSGALSIPLHHRREDGLDKLNGRKGETPCMMMNQTVTPCLDWPESSFPSPSPCTCNNVFFNLWSACLFSNGNATLPLYSDWGHQCQDNLLTLKDGYPVQLRQNMNLPGWAFLTVPPSTSQFDISSAMQMAEPRGWTKTQILLPMAVGVLGIGLLAFYIWRSRLKHISRWSLKNVRLRPHHPVHQIKRAERSSTWTIDPPEVFGGCQMGDYDRTRHYEGHHRLSSSETVFPLNGHSTAQTGRHLPGKKFWKYSRIAQRFRRLSNLVSPIVQSRTQDVQIDAFTSIPPNSIASKLSTSELVAGRYTHPMTTADNALDNHEGTSLISPEERDANRVLLIGRYPDIDFTVESGDYDRIEVVPATPTSDDDGPFSSSIPLTPPKTRPAIPPVPKTPPPSPPPSVPLPPLPSNPSRHTAPPSQPSPRHLSRNSLSIDPRPSSSRESRDVQPMSPPLTPPLPMPLRHLANTPPLLSLHPLSTDSSTQAHASSSSSMSMSTHAGRPPDAGTTLTRSKQNSRSLLRPNGKRPRTSPSVSPSRTEHTTPGPEVVVDRDRRPRPSTLTHEGESNRRRGASASVFIRIPKEPPDITSMNKS